MTTLADIVREFGPSYLERYGPGMLPSHRKALGDIADCHTSAMGGHRFHCEDCGEDHYQYHSCRNRSCPSCQSADREEWIDDRLRDLLPCRYFHLVFTLPHELNHLIRSYQAVLLDILMRAAGDSLKVLAADPKRLGGKIGALQVLHTWGSTMEYHPHVHCLVPGGALRKAAGIWATSKKRFFLPVKALSRLFRWKFLRMFRKAFPEELIPGCLHRKKKWVVYCKPIDQDPKRVIEYLGRYIHRTAISNGRILSVQDDKVTFAYKDYRTRSKKTMTLPAHEFLRRFLQHILPRGFHKVRYLGLFSPSCRADFLFLQTSLWRLAGRMFPELPPREPRIICCKHCGSLRVLLAEVLPRASRGPPREALHPRFHGWLDPANSIT